MNITYRTEYGILEVQPTGPLEKQDFQDLAAEIKGIRERGREFKGVLIFTKEFPGYRELSDVVAHGEFVQEHLGKVPKVALCTDSATGKLLELIGQSFGEAEAKHFAGDEKDEAEKWLLV
jgi:hypothetical protein